MRPVCLVSSTILCIGFLASPVQSAVLVDVGGGVEVPLGEDRREDFGGAPSLALGVALDVGGGRTWLFLDSGYVWDTGDYRGITYDGNDPDVKYRLIPVNFGVRTDFMNPGVSDKFAIYGGLGLQTTFTRRGDHESTPTVGLLLEVRPELKLGPSWRAWFRQLLTFLPAAVDDGSGSGANYGASSTQLGVSWAP